MAMLLASDYDKSKYFRAEDLKRDTKFRAAAATEEVLEKDGKPEKRLVLWFTNDDRGLVLNKTNLRALRGAFGDNTADWNGRVIAIYPTMTNFRGNMVPALRVRIPPPKQAAVAPQQPVTPGNGAAAPVTAAAAPLVVEPPAAADPDLEDDPVKPLRDELDDEIAF